MENKLAGRIKAMMNFLVVIKRIVEKPWCKSIQRFSSWVNKENHMQISGRRRLAEVGASNAWIAKLQKKVRSY